MPRSALFVIVAAVLALTACSAPPAQSQRTAPSSGADAAAETQRQRDAAVQGHLANARDYRSNDQHGLALTELTQALAIQPNDTEAQDLQREVRGEATAQVQEARAQATAAAQIYARLVADP